MVRRMWFAPMGLASLCLPAWAADPQPIKLGLEPQAPSVYALPEPVKESEGVNMGGVHVDIKISYLTDYIYRGVDRTAFIADVTRGQTTERANFQFDGKLSFDLGKLPSPFIGVFTNVLDNDPVSNFQEVRPMFGAEWRIRPLVIAAGNNTYEFPDRNPLNTGEAWGKVTLDDAAVLSRNEPLLSPYLYGAYDYDQYNGWYLEMGVSHDFAIEKTGITLTLLADIAYVDGHGYFVGPSGDDTGFQHYELGIIGKYNLNLLLNIPERYGQWSLNGYLYYTDGLDGSLRADTQFWGGAGIEFSY